MFRQASNNCAKRVINDYCQNEFTLTAVQEGRCKKRSTFAGKSSHSTSLAMIQGYFYTKKRSNMQS